MAQADGIRISCLKTLDVTTEGGEWAGEVVNAAGPDEILSYGEAEGLLKEIESGKKGRSLSAENKRSLLDGGVVKLFGSVKALDEIAKKFIAVFSPPKVSFSRLLTRQPLGSYGSNWEFVQDRHKAGPFLIVAFPNDGDQFAPTGKIEFRWVEKGTDGEYKLLEKSPSHEEVVNIFNDLGTTNQQFRRSIFASNNVKNTITSDQLKFCVSVAVRAFYFREEDQESLPVSGRVRDLPYFAIVKDIERVASTHLRDWSWNSARFRVGLAEVAYRKAMACVQQHAKDSAEYKEDLAEAQKIGRTILDYYKDDWARSLVSSPKITIDPRKVKETVKKMVYFIPEKISRADSNKHTQLRIKSEMENLFKNDPVLLQEWKSLVALEKK